MKSEKGQALPLAIMVLAVGTLVITPFLSHAGSSLIGSGVYEQSLTELYSCDAGIEYAIWGLQNGALAVAEGDSETLPEFTINGKTVDIIVDNPGSQLYLVTATATSDDGHSTTIESTLSASGDEYVQGDIELGWQETYTGDAMADGDIILGSEAEIDGSAYATGNIELGWRAEITGDAAAEGNITLGSEATIDGSAHADGDIQLDWQAEIKGNACADGNITLGSQAKIEGDINTTGNIELGWDAEANGDIYMSGTPGELILQSQATIGNDVYITGDIEDIRLGYQAKIEGGIYITGNILGSLQMDWQASIADGVHENYSGEYPPPPACPSLPSDSGILTILS